MPSCWGFLDGRACSPPDSSTATLLISVERVNKKLRITIGLSEEGSGGGRTRRRDDDLLLAVRAQRPPPEVAQAPCDTEPAQLQQGHQLGWEIHSMRQPHLAHAPGVSRFVKNVDVVDLRDPVVDVVGRVDQLLAGFGMMKPGARPALA